MRLLRGTDGWWCLEAGRLAQLPPKAVTDSGGIRLRARAGLRLGGFFRETPRDTFSVTIFTSTACNLGCAYCFQNTAPAPSGTFRPQRIASRRLGPAEIARALAFIERQMAAGGYSKLDLLLFGGEPLLNPDGCLALLEGAAALQLTQANMVSNCVLLRPPLAEKLAHAGLRKVQVTFDGSRATHDATRVTRRGGPTFDRIVANLGWAVANTPLQFTARINVSHANQSGVSELLEQLAEAGVARGTAISIALLSDFGVGVSNDLKPGAAALHSLLGWYERALDLGFVVHMPPSTFKCSYCGEVGGRTGAVINADGTLYSCWESVGRTAMEVGDVEAGYLDEARLGERWVSCLYSARPSVSEEEAVGFRDRLDAAILDLLHRRGRLARPSTAGEPDLH